MEGVSNFEIRTLAYLLAHIVGRFFQNIPAENDNTRLVHIGDVEQATTQNQVAEFVFKTINHTSFPSHYVLYAQHHDEQYYA